MRMFFNKGSSQNIFLVKRGLGRICGNEESFAFNNGPLVTTFFEPVGEKKELAKGGRRYDERKSWSVAKKQHQIKFSPA